jgi:hypothetical protein
MKKYHITIRLVSLIVINLFNPFSASCNTFESFNISSGDYPIFYNGATIQCNFIVKNTNFFQPLFSADRTVVNPVYPRISHHGNKSVLHFDSPGEYYLNLNNKHIKICVLDANEPISSSVLRVFDFLSANSLVTCGNDKQFYQDPNHFTKSFFQSKDPFLLLCGPTLSLFQNIINLKFKLPCRDVTFTGVYMDSGQLKYVTHNLLEIYLPDIKKWCLFDINNGFIVKWLDSFELTNAIRSVSNSKLTISNDEFYSLTLDYHSSVYRYRSNNAADSRSLFSRDLISNSSSMEGWTMLAKMFLGGPGYWSGCRFKQISGLPSDYHLYLSKYHSDPFLLEAQKKWISNWSLSSTHIPPDELNKMLDSAYREQINKADWINAIYKLKKHSCKFQL